MPIRSYFREPFPGISHLIGALLSLAGLVFLLFLAHGRLWYVVGFGIYGVSSIVLFLASGLCHSLPMNEARMTRWDRFDRAAIFGLIAGTYTPICMLRIIQPWGAIILAVEWTLAIAGILAILLNRPKQRWVRTMLYVVVGWLGMLALLPVRDSLPPAAMVWLFAGGAFYSLGAVVFFTNWPCLWPERFIAHDLWHLMVIAGGICFFVLIARYVA